MKRIGTYDMKRKVIVVDKSQTAQWEGTAQMSSRLWFRFLLKKKTLEQMSTIQSSFIKQKA